MTDCPPIALLYGRSSTVEAVGPSLTSLRIHPLNPEVKSPDEVKVTLGDPPVIKNCTNASKFIIYIVSEINIKVVNNRNKHKIF